MPNLRRQTPIGYIEKKFYIYFLIQSSLPISRKVIELPEYNEIELAEKIKSGDAEAENHLFLRFQGEIEMMVWARMSREPAENRADTMAKINAGILQSLRKGSFDPTKGKSLGAFIAGTTYNTIAMYFRKKKTDRKFFDPGSMDDHPEPSANPLQLNEMVSREEITQVKSCLRRLNPTYATALALRFYQDLSIGEMAEMLKLERRRVSERINYGLKLLLKCIKKGK